MTSHLMAAYAPQNVTFSSGRGSWLTDTTGKQYLDFLGGIAVMCLGHSHPKLTRVIAEQAGKLMQVSNGFHIQEQIDLADKLAQITGLDKAFFCSTGAEANEAMIKIARLYGNRKGIDTPTIVVMEKAFHGRTMATITASGNTKVQEGFEPLLEGFIRCPYNDLSALQEILASHDNIVGVMLEPIQGEGGINIPDDAYLPGVRQLCDEYDVFMMLDEVQTGVGRTGKWFAYQHYDFLPDIITSAKALGCGYPVAACVARGKAAEVFQPGNHGTTYGGNPLASKVALTVLNIIEEEQLLTHSQEMGQYLIQAFDKALSGCSAVVSIRGKGLMIGIELDRPCLELRGQGLAAEPGLVFNVTAQKVIRLVPPLTLSKEEADTFVEYLSRLIIEFVKQEAK